MSAAFLKKAVLKDEPFMAELRAALQAQRSRLWWVGQSGFIWVQRGRAVVFDPYLSDSLTRKYAQTDKPHVRVTERVVAPEALGSIGVIDAITCSHNHTDHLDPETLLPLLRANPQARIIAPAANLGFVAERLGSGVRDRLVGVDDGTSTQLGDVTFTGVAAAHNCVERDDLGRCRFLGYVASWKGKRIYHSGDTLRHEGIVKAVAALKVDVALLPINGNRPERRVAGNLDGVEAGRLAADIRAGLVIPCHFDMFEFNTASPDAFVEECHRLNQPYRLLGHGEGVDI